MTRDLPTGETEPEEALDSRTQSELKAREKYSTEDKGIKSDIHSASTPSSPTLLPNMGSQEWTPSFPPLGKNGEKPITQEKRAVDKPHTYTQSF